MTTETTMNSDFGRSVFSRLSNAIDSVETDISLCVKAAIAGNVDPLQGVFDEAFELKASVGKDAGRAVAQKYAVLMKRAYFHASKAEYVLQMPRLDGKGEIKVPTLTPKDEHKATRAAERAEQNAKNERALQEHATRQQERKLAELQSLTVDKLYLEIVEKLNASPVTALELMQRLAIGLNDKDAKVLRDFLTKDVLSTPRKRSANKAAKASPKAA